MYENKEYKFLIYIKVKKPSDIEINLIKQVVYKYTVPGGFEYGFVSKNNKELDPEIENIIKILEYMNIKELIELCKNKGIQGYSRYKKKKDLILFIQNELEN
jgi:hypothetical protein